MTDKHGRNYETLLTLQRTELEQWKAVLRPYVFAELKAWCKATNAPAHDSRTLHACPVGCELHHFVMAFTPAPIEDDLNALLA